MHTKTLDRFIGYAIEQDALDIVSFKNLLKDYNAGKLALPETPDTQEDPKISSKGGEYRDDDPELLRDCDYYEQNVGGLSNGC